MKIAVPERWAPWTRWPERYLISTWGWVHSIDPGKVPQPNVRIHRGQKIIVFRIGRYRRQYVVKRMVAETFMPDYDPALPLKYFDPLGMSPNIENLYQVPLPGIGTYVPDFNRTWEAPGLRPVRNVQTREEFLSVTDAAKHYGVSTSDIRQVLRGKQIHTLGFQFERMEPYGF